MIEKIKSVVNLAFFRGFGAVAILLVYFVSARVYEDIQTALLAFLITVSSLVTPVILTGLHTFALKRLATGSVDAEDLIATTIWRFFRYASPLCATSVLVTFYVYDSQEWIYISFVAAVMIILNPLVALFSSLLQAKQRYNSAIFILNINPFIAISFFILIVNYFGIEYKNNTYSVYFVYAISGFISFVVSSALFLSLLSLKLALLWSRRSSFTMDRRSYSEQFWLWVVMILVNLSIWMPQILFYLTGAGADYAYFGAAERIANSINFFVIISNFYLTPIAAKLFHEGKMELLRQAYVSVTRIICVVALPVTIIIIIFSKEILSYIGPSYVNGADFLIVMAVAQFANVFFGSIKTILNMANAEVELVMSLLIALACEIAIIVAFAGEYGGLAFAVAYAVNLFVQNAASSIFGWFRFRINIFSILWK